MTSRYVRRTNLPSVADAEKHWASSASAVVVIRAWREDDDLRARILFDPEDQPTPRSVVVIAREALCEAVWTYLTTKLPRPVPPTNEG